jgi:putative transposase
VVEPNHPQLSLVRQCQFLGMSRSSLYYQPVGPSEEELTLLRLIDEQYLKTPFYGSRRMVPHLRQQGFEVNRKRVQRLMHQLGVQAIYPKPKLSQTHPDHKVYPYLLRGVDIVAVNQVWSTDITYLPVLKGHFYLVAIMDWFSRKVLSWQVSNTMDVQFALNALEEALSRYAKPTSSTQIKVLSLPLRRLRNGFIRRISKSAWMVGGAVTTTFSLNVYGGR